MVACSGGGKDRGERIVREFGMIMYTLIYLKCITNKDLLYRAGNCAQCYVAAWRGFGRMDACMCMVSPFAVHLKLSKRS